MKEIRLGDFEAEQRTRNDLRETNKLLRLLIEVYDQKNLAIQLAKLAALKDGAELKTLRIDRTELNRWSKDPEKNAIIIDENARDFIKQQLLPKKPAHWDNEEFTFIDLFAGIGGLRKGFEDIGGKCIFTSEWEQKARRTYLANHYVDEHELDYFLNSEEENPERNTSFMDITKVTQSGNNLMNREEKCEHIKKHIPAHDVLLAGFPCQPFSLAGVSKKNSLGRAHGFNCDTQGTLFFDVEQILNARQPKFFVLENVKNLKSHDKGNTFATIIHSLDNAGYWVANITDEGVDIEEAIANVRKRKQDPVVIDGAHFTPQHRERVCLVGVRKDLIAKDPTMKEIDLNKIPKPEKRYTIAEILCELSKEDRDKYTLTENLWNYLYHYALKHQSKGNGFGFGLVDPKSPDAVTRTLSARYHKDGSEILINQSGLEDSYLLDNRMHAIRKNQAREAFSIGHADRAKLENPEMTELEYKAVVKEWEKLYDRENGRYAPEFDATYKTPRRLTPQECARLMGFEKPEFDRDESDTDFRIVCADASAYKQFGNSVVVPVFRAVAQLIGPFIGKAKALEEEQKENAA
ncbi:MULTISPECIES: DNA (cytosine-5-)-methyltransferase [Alteromonadales]|jgi:DNA (cytosine-5)-methyltransferase 1|uniref:DNA (cytosine-5-)-methyltransferase n=1 Tax=Alteromonadales TaxID=135622 RepID=UPI001AAE47FE|nr:MULTISPECIES: DNA (cytosine-5-)-methyltransferase [Shewanella]MBO2695316.1 DNA (cytosine-5-)-methyltransferase [Shewanella algae]MCA0951638.1 DNA (cytosine-5-)-methyltransferase [Shewanella chilikensis]